MGACCAPIAPRYAIDCAPQTRPIRKTFATVNPATGAVLAHIGARNAVDIALANDSVYRLAASVYTGALNRAIRLSRDSRAGVVTVNGFDEGDVPTPFDGYQDSGFGGRDKSVRARDPYPEIKTIRIDVPMNPAQAGCMALPLSAALHDGCNRIIPFAIAARAGGTESPEIEFEC
ncbi:aldehyde dehydrogenase family protein [Burkholderia sp. LMG 32019]|uniref:aldehyde dehydrogenase family protein n=1 Tax=Burkholderia sp. LMG 32019 TaxID=3158173 RepID=UPI003C2F6CBF